MNRGTRRVWLVARREWNVRARSRAFQISTVISILVVVALIVVPQMYGGGSSTRTVGLVGQSATQLPEILRAAGDPLDLSVKSRTYADEAAGLAALRSGDASVLLVDQGQLVWKAQTDDRLQAVVTSALQEVEQQQAVGELGLTPEQAQRLLGPPDLSSRSLEPVTKEHNARVALATIGVILLFMAIVFYGGFLLVGIIEEKSSRVVEVLLSRLRPTELMAGKILGIGLVGLAQLAAVGASALVALALSDNTQIPKTAPSTIAWVVFWFVLGFGFYSVLYATAGSLVSRQEDAQSIQFPITAVLFVGYFWALGTAQSPDSVAAVLGSLFPPTAPLLMTVRLANGPVPWWQIVLSVALLLGAIYGMVQLAGRIYAGAVLRIGQRVRLREAWRGGEA